MSPFSVSLQFTATKAGVVILLAAIHAGCSFRQPTPATGGRRPYFGNFYCDTNPTDQRVTFVAQARFVAGSQGRGLRPEGTLLRVLEVRQARPQQRVCFRWPWISDEGRVGMVIGRDTSWGEWFNPWP